MSDDDTDTERLSDIMKRAEAGDAEAAREVVSHLAFIFSRANPAPIPDFVKDYVSRAFYGIEGAGDAADAFHLRSKGRRPEWSHHTKRRAVSVMRQLIDQHATVEQASADAAELINAFAQDAGDDNPTWGKFGAKPIEASTLQTWYYAERKSP